MQTTIKTLIMKFANTIIVAILFTFLLSSCDEGGVRMKNNMEKYAIEYLNEHDILEEDEEIVAYYDYTVSLDGTEAAILTDKRLIYYNEETTTTSMDLDDIEDIDHRQESLIGDIIEITSNDGEIMVIEIAPLNNGETFLKALRAKVESAS